MLPCIIYTPTCFDILCYHQGLTHLLLAKLHKFLDEAVRFYKIIIIIIIIIKMSKYIIIYCMLYNYYKNIIKCNLFISFGPFYH